MIKVNSSTIIVENEEKITKFLSQDLIHKLSNINGYISLGYIVLQWILIIFAIVLYSFFVDDLHTFYLYPLIVIWIGSRQHALGYLMHEGSHYFLFPKNKIVNDFVGELFAAWPLFLSMRNYRETHFNHHRHATTNKDPEWMRRQTLASWQFPTTSVKLFLILLKTVLGLNTVSMLTTFNPKRNSNPSQNQKKSNLFFLRLGYYLLIVAILTYLKLWTIIALYWFVPYLTWLQLISRLRSIAEHYALEYDQPLRQTRSISTNLWEKLFIAPLNLNYHLEHHLYPSVPFYNLAKLHQCLLKSDVFRQEAHLTNGYLGVLKECTLKN